VPNVDTRLKVLSGSFFGQTIRVSCKLLIGRGEDCDLRLESQFVSAHHCVLLVDDDILRIRDLGSKNGTFVSGHQIGTHVTNLSHSDTIAIGDVLLLIELAPVKPVPASPAPASLATQPADEQAASQVSQTALAETGCFEGDTLQADRPAEMPTLPSKELPAATPSLPNAVPVSSDQDGAAQREEGGEWLT
jgi:predicted component of type VI protein secretion system